MNRFRRIIIYPKDISIITGKSERYGRSTINKIKKELGKQDHQSITFKEYSEYSGIDLELIEFTIFGPAFKH
jgi:hypothetical protein